MNDALTRALASIEAESPNFDKSFELVDQLLLAYGEDNLANRLISDITEETDWRVVASLFAILQWSTSDNGHAIAQTAERWLLDCDDERKVNIALNLETYPFSDKAEMEKALGLAANKFPSCIDRCKWLIKSRK